VAARPLGARTRPPVRPASVYSSDSLLERLGPGRLLTLLVAAVVIVAAVVAVTTGGLITAQAAGTTSMVMSSVPPEKAGMASGTQSTTRQLGGALGVAVLGSLLAARYATNLSHALSGTAAQRYLPTARRSLGQALRAAPGAGAVQTFLTRVSRAAFVDGLHVVAWTAAASAAAGAVVVFLVLKPSPAATELDGGAVATDEAAVTRAIGLSPDER